MLLSNVDSYMLKCKDVCYTWIVLWVTSLSWLIVYECALSMVTSKEYLVWVVVWDAICTLHKYDLELS